MSVSAVTSKSCIRTIELSTDEQSIIGNRIIVYKNTMAGLRNLSLAYMTANLNQKPFKAGNSRQRATAKLMLSLFFSFICSMTGSYGSETVVVNKAFNKREIKVRVGSHIRVELEELGTAGYAWTIQELDGEHFEVVREFRDASKPSDDTTGVPGIKKWLIQTLKPGKSELEFFHYRPWEDPESASDTFTLKVRIIP